MNTDFVQSIQTFLSTTAIDVGIKVLAAIVFFIVGRWIIGRVTTAIGLLMQKNQIDPTLRSYAVSILGVLLNIVLVIGVLGYFGVETTSFAALLAGVGLAIGAAWGGLLANFASGAFLLILRPYRVGDIVVVGGNTGQVKEIGLFTTTLITGDNVQVAVGNNKVFSGDIINYSSLPARRVDMSVQLAHGVDPFVAIEKLKVAVTTIPNVVSSPAPDVFIQAFNELGTVIAVRPFTHTDNFGQVGADVNAMIARMSKESGWATPSRLVTQK